MRLILKADVEFHAISIEDAFNKLSEHFASLVHDEPTELFLRGKIEIEPHLKRLYEGGRYTDEKFS